MVADDVVDIDLQSPVSQCQSLSLQTGWSQLVMLQIHDYVSTIDLHRYGGRKCANTIGTVLVPSVAISSAKV